MQEKKGCASLPHQANDASDPCNAIGLPSEAMVYNDFGVIKSLNPLQFLLVQVRTSYNPHRSNCAMRLPYVPDPPNFTSPEDQAVEQRVRARRGEKGLIALDRTLLHAPTVADGW